jgi:dihydrofolate reductase
MSKLRVHNFSISLDGFAAGPHQGPDHPLGIGGEQLHEWVFADQPDEIDAARLARAQDNIGATIMGRNMFGPVRGDWPETGELADWRGWWGDEPPYHSDVFVLTSHPRKSFRMSGGTTFHFVTGGPDAAVDRAVAAAGGRDVLVGGGASTLQQFLRAGLLNEINLVIVPVLLGRGERLFDGFDHTSVGYRCAELVSSSSVVHARLVRR